VYASQTTPAQMDNGRKIDNDNILKLDLRAEHNAQGGSVGLYLPFFNRRDPKIKLRLHALRCCPGQASL
jgi:hypothetical protein